MNSQFTSFQKTLKNHQINLLRNEVETLQINIGKLCNLACSHCHVEAGPQRTENMTRQTIDELLVLIKNTPSIKTVDLTGGAPELNENFRYFISEVRKLNIEVIDRCNLTVLFEQGQEDTAQFLKEQQVKIVASLPCYSKDNVEAQRGRGVFNKSIEALRILNHLGYGMEGTNLILDLVYNPNGAFLPPAQEKLEKDYKKELKELFNISFNNLYTITNMPIKRFNTYLNREENGLENYMQLLLDNFNPSAAKGVMCKNMVSIGWDGKIYDCDFNQMLELPVSSTHKSIDGLNNFSNFTNSQIVVKDHCYACTAGSGSSCGGATI